MDWPILSKAVPGKSCDDSWKISNPRMHLLSQTLHFRPFVFIVQAEEGLMVFLQMNV